MNKEKKRPSLRVSTGITSLMMVFVVLCMTVFATLNYVQANRNAKMISATTEQSKAYYNADYLASKYLESLLDELSSNTASAVLEQHQSDADVDNTIMKAFEINSNKELVVKLKIENSTIQILMWDVVVSIDGEYGLQGTDY